MTTKNEIPLRICIGCGDQIPAERIQATSRATRCVPCETKHERQQKNASREQAEKVKPKKKRPKKLLLSYNEDVAESADGGFEIVKKRPTKSDR
jgi:DksA/TraR C4-type zinc finger protein